MLLAEKGNRVVEINDVDLDHYAKLGYSIKDADGKVITESSDDIIGQLKAENESLKKRVADLEAELNKAVDKPVKTTTKKKTVEE